MVDLSTTYLGLELATPLVVSASPLCESVENVQRMEEAGAGAVVLHSLFEEQLEIESLDFDRAFSRGTEGYAEAITYFPDMTGYNLGSEGYLDLIRRLKKTVKIPIIASLNGVTPGGWLHYACAVEEAGADALELNVYDLASDPVRSSLQVEQGYRDLITALKADLKIPLSVKLSPFFTAPVAFARSLSEAGANGLVLFNRFYQPDFNLESLEVQPALHLSTPGELLLRLHWVALMYGQVNLDLAVTGGVHGGLDVLKSMMAGAKVAMMTSALMKHGIEYLTQIKGHLKHWMGEHGYESIRQMQGSMSFRSVADPWAFERANYMKVLRSFAVRERR